MKALLAGMLAFLLIGGCSLIKFDDSDGLSLNPSDDYQILEEEETIRVRFSESVEKYTAEQIVSLNKREGEIDYTLSWKDSRTLVVSPDDPLVPGILYILEAKGIYHTGGGSNREADRTVPFYYLSKDFSPLQVISSSPEEGSVSGNNSDIIILFNRSPEEASLIKNLSLSPNTAYDYALNGAELRISPQDKWENLADYSLTLGSETLDAAGIPLDPEFELNFAVSAGSGIPSVVNGAPADNDYASSYPYKTVNPAILEYKDAFRIIFSENMDTDSVDNAFSLEPALAGNSYWVGENALIFVPEQGWVMGTDYTLRIGKEAESADGIVMAEDYYALLRPDIEELELSSLECITGGGFTLTSYSPAAAYDLPTNPISPYDIAFTLVFSRPFATNSEKQAAQETVSCYETFSSGGSPRAATLGWSSDTTLTITFSGFNADSEKDHYYIFEITGGEQGIRNDEGSFMSKTVKQLFRSRL